MTARTAEPPLMYVRVAAIGSAELGLTPDQAIATLALAMTELAKCTALMLIHGTDVGWVRYVELGGCARQDSQRQPWVPVVTS